MILTDRKAKIISYIILSLMVVAIVGLSIFAANKSKQCKLKDNEIENLQSKIGVLEDNIYKLGAEEVLSVTCNINIKSTNVMGVNTINSNNLAKEISQMTRKELYDSIYGPKRDINDIKLDTITTQNGAKVIVGNKKK